jgi:2-polyprenyl-6-methoxyphenol hydroxylase-like FAD-dependent oxidoreductase
VREEVVDAGVVYSSAWFESPAEIQDDWMVIATLPALPRDPHMGILVRSANKLLCSAVAYGKPKSPQSPRELVERMKEVGVPQIHQLLAASTPISEVVSFANTQNRRRFYGGAPNFPEGLVVVGDSVCSLNPRYGQGMTVAALAVRELHEGLSAYFAEQKTLEGFSRYFQRRLDKTLTVPWQIALLEDRGWVTTLSGRPLSASEPSNAEYSGSFARPSRIWTLIFAL